MPICNACRGAAEGRVQAPCCSACDREWVSVYRTDVPVEEQRVVFHKRDVLITHHRGGERVQYTERARCPGTGKPPVFRSGHDACDGCPCQHRPRGSWKGGS